MHQIVPVDGGLSGIGDRDQAQTEQISLIRFDCNPPQPSGALLLCYMRDGTNRLDLVRCGRVHLDRNP